MPTLLSESDLELEFTDLFQRSPIVRPHQPPSRAPGVHQSDILSHIGKLFNWYRPGEELEETCPWRIAMGFMFEEFYFSLRPETIWQPGERIKDGIAANCDGLIVKPKMRNQLEETKCTEKKVRTGEEFLHERMWMHQGRAYCEVYDADIMMWTVLFYRGDYRGSGPICRQYTIQFSRAEIKQTWNLLVRSRDRVRDLKGISTV